MPGQSRPGRSHGRNLGQHFLESAALAGRLAREAGIAPSDHVVEFGAGSGALTAALVDCGARVFAVEVDRSLVARLVQRFGDASAVTVFECDAIEFPLPSTPFRVFANPPFNRTAAILHRLLDDPAGGLVRADLVVQWQVARARAQAGAQVPLDLVGASWGPWWVFRRARRLPAKLFRPAPSVDAALLTVTRREAGLLPVEVAPQFMDFVRDRFAAAPPQRGVDDWVRRFTAR
ncbi:MAG: rRNA adenine N(6)-methyltransferase family protein [Acidimicrobiia bacterium]